MEVTLSNNKYDEIEKLIESRAIEARLILKEKHSLVIPDECEDFLKRCLRVKDGNLEKGIKLLLAYHSSVSGMLGWDVIMRPGAFKKQYRTGQIVPLKKRDASGRLIYIMRIGMWNHKEVTFDQAACCIWMIAQYINSELIDIQREGSVLIWDFNNFTIQQAWAVKQWRVFFLARMTQNGVGGRVNVIHVINHPRIVNPIYSGVKPFLTEKMKKRIIFHPDQQSLVDHFGADRLPDYLGGTLHPENCVDTTFIEDFLNSDYYFEEMERLKLPIK